MSVQVSTEYMDFLMSVSMHVYFEWEIVGFSE